MNGIKRYRLSIALFLLTFLLWMWRPALGEDIAVRTARSFREMLGVLPPIFILLGLLEVWVPRELIIRNLGDTSGARGIGLSMLLGAAAAGPLYIAFPVAVTMLKKGARYSNVMTFLFSWSTLKLPLILFEASALGWRMAAVRAAVNIPGIILLAHSVNSLMPGAVVAEQRERLMSQQ